jgi:ammonium transporter, Amt family
MTVTQIATATAALAWMFAEWLVHGKPSVLGIASGAVAGLVAITPASGFVDAKGALVIGAAAGVGCYISATGLKRLLGYDDSLDVFGVHCIGGIIGALLTGVFAVQAIGGTAGVLEGNFAQLPIQAYGVMATLIWSGAVSFVLMVLLRLTIGVRVSEAAEVEGLDLALHGETVQ